MTELSASADFPLPTPDVAINAQKPSWGARLKALGSSFGQGIVPQQPTAETAVQDIPTTEPIVNHAAPATETISRTPPPGLSPMAEKVWRIKHAQIDANVGSTLPPDLDKPSTGTASEPLIAGYSVMSNRTGEAVRAQEAASEKARADAAIARAASSDIDSIRAIATAEPGITEKAAVAATSVFRRVTEGRRFAGNGEPPLVPSPPTPAERQKYDNPYGISNLTGEPVQSVELLKEQAVAQQINAAAITSGGIRLSDPAKEAAFNIRVKTSVDAANAATKEIAIKLEEAAEAEEAA